MKNNTTVYDCNLLHLNQIGDRNGHITAINNNVELPFAVKRIYYLYDVPMGSERGGHGHFELEQFIIAASGSFTFILDDGINKKEVFLNNPSQALHIKSGIWREIKNFSSGSICLVLASHEYNESDYIREYVEYLKYKNDTHII